ncbi:MAG: SulP family inorganic anion transporter [Planctomycetales bacterium]
MDPGTDSTPVHWWSAFPPAQWLSSYQAVWLKSDALAGVTLAAFAVPVSMAYASLAGLPPQAGIYGYLAGGLLYALFGTSRQFAMGPTSAISMLVGTTIAGMDVGDPDRRAGIAALAAMIVASLCALAWLWRLSTLVNFISETILLGFKAGAALTIAMTQLPKLFGVPGGGEFFFERVWILGSQLGECQVAVLGFGLMALALLLAGERFLPGWPVALIVVVVSIVAVSLLSLGQYGVATVGTLPQGLPALQLPPMRLRDIDGIVPLASACLILAYIEGISAARTLASKHDYEVSPRQELLGLGMANLAAAFAQGFPVTGGLSQSVVNDQAGAKSPLSLVFASATLALCLLFLTGLLKNLPTVVLAAIVLVAVRGLIDIAELRRLYRVSRFEFSISIVAFSGVLLLGILKGVLLAAAVSLLMLLRGAAHPHVAILGRIPGSRRYSDRERHADNESIPGLLAFRVEGPLLYLNADFVRESVWRMIRSMPELRLVVCDLSNAPYVDVAGACMLGRMHQELILRGAALRVVEAHAHVRDLLRAEGLEEQVGHLSRSSTLDGVVTEFERRYMAADLSSDV